MEFEHLGFRWGFTFMRTAAHLPYQEIEDLMRQATEMYLEGKEERQVGGADYNYEGILRDSGKYDVLGPFGGKRYDAVLETNKGKDTASFLIREMSGGGIFSKN